MHLILQGMTLLSFLQLFSTTLLYFFQEPCPGQKYHPEREWRIRWWCQATREDFIKINIINKKIHNEWRIVQNFELLIKIHGRSQDWDLFTSNHSNQGLKVSGWQRNWSDSRTIDTGGDSSHLDIVVRKVIGDTAFVGPVLRPVALALSPGPGPTLLSGSVIGQLL